MGVVVCLAFVTVAARAQPHASPSPDPLAAARALFGEALRDEEAGRFADALEKFERVRAVRDTASIEYRIGSCYEGLGEPALAFRAYLVARALGSDDPQGADASHAASDRLDALAKHVARLTLAMPSPAPADAEVQIDGVVVAPGAPIPLSPGRHVVSATADGAVPFRSEIALAEGAQVTLSVVLAPSSSAPTGPPATGTDSPFAAPTDSPSAAPWLAIGGGGALLTASAILLVARHGDIAHLDRTCPGGSCPPGADANDLESIRNRALVEGPVAVACGAAGIALAAIGVYWIAGAHRSGAGGSTLAAIPMVAPGVVGFALSGGLR